MAPDCTLLSAFFYVPRKAEITKRSFVLRRHFLSAVVDVYSEFLDFYIRHDVDFRKTVGVKRLNSPDQTKTDSMVVLNFVRNSATFLKFRSQNHNLGRICDHFSPNLEHCHWEFWVTFGEKKILQWARITDHSPLEIIPIWVRSLKPAPQIMMKL